MEALSLSAPEQAETRDPLGELARAAAAGDLAAMRQLLDAVAPRLWRVVRSVLGPWAADVDDVAQESLIALVRALPAFRSECAVEGYAARIAVRTAVAAQKRRTGRERRLKDLPTEDEPIEPPAAERYAAELRKEL